MSAEGRGLRAIKGKGLIVRYGDPFANRTTDVMFESNEPLVGVAIAGDGAWKSSPSSLLPPGLRVIRAIAFDGSQWKHVARALG